MERRFFGRKDPSRILLSDVVFGSDVTFSVPFKEEGKYRQVVVEGSDLDDLEVHLDNLTILSPREHLFGRWVMVGEHEETRGLQLVYDPQGDELQAVQLLVFVLRKHLVQVCDLCLSPYSRLEATLRQTVFLAETVPLPPEIGNGHVLLPKIILPAANFEIIN